VLSLKISKIAVLAVEHRGAHTLGFLMGTLGIGALVAAGYLATRKSVVGLEREPLIISDGSRYLRANRE
jgi:hypothetical protein